MIIDEFNKILKNEIQTLSYKFQLFIKDGMNKGVGSAGEKVIFAPNSTKKLDVQSGALLRSFGVRDKNNFNKLNQTSDGITWEFGSKLPYAKIHDEGGFIKAKKKAKLRPKAYAMESFFWAKYYETRSPYYKNMALHLSKLTKEGGKVGIQIPKRPYFTQAEKQLEKEVPRFVNTVVNKFKEVFDNAAG